MLPRSAGSVVLIVLALAAAILASYEIPAAFRRNAERDHEDFRVFYEGAQCLMHGGCSAYDLRERRSPNLLPPHGHLIVAPVAALPADRAYIIATVAGLGAIFGSFVLALRGLGRLGDRRAWLAVPLIAGSVLVWAQIESGNVYALLSLPVTAAWLAWRQHRMTRAAVWLGLAASVKVLLLLVVLWWLVHRQYRAAAAAIGAAACVTAAGLVLFGADAYVAWLQRLIGTPAEADYLGSSIMQAAGRWMLVGGLPPAIGWALLGVLAGVVTVATLMPERQDIDETMLMLLSAAILLSPKGWIGAAVWLVGPGLAVVARGRPRWLLILGGLLMLVPASVAGTRVDSFAAAMTIGSLYFWTLMVIWLAVARAPRRI